MTASNITQDSLKNKLTYCPESGVTGVIWSKQNNRWNTQITVDKKRIHLGSFVELSEAVNTRKNAEVLYGFHENHGKDK